MPDFLQSIKYVTGPLTLVAFLAVIILAIYRRSVDDKRGLEYLYNLFSTQLSKNHFYDLARKIINLAFAAFIIILILAFAAWAYAKWLDSQRPNGSPSGESHLPSTGLEIDHVRETGKHELDVMFRNLSDDAIIIKQITVMVVKDYRICPEAAFKPSAAYKLPIDGLAEGESKSLDVAYVIDAHKADRMLISLETNCVYDVKVTFSTNKNDSLSFTHKI